MTNGNDDSDPRIARYRELLGLLETGRPEDALSKSPSTIDGDDQMPAR